MTLKILLFLSTCILGVFCGTQLAEAALIVPYWKGLSADDFFTFYKTYGAKLHQFYAPLTVFATLLPIVTFIYSLLSKSKTPLLIWLMAIFCVLFFLTFFIYFKDANVSFAERTISNKELPQELMKWAKWHWARVVFELIAFVCGLISLLRFKQVLQ